MRILTVRNPWAWAIVHRGKDVENRTRNIAGDYRGPVLIHAGLAWDWDSRLLVGETPHPTDPSQVRGAIIGVVDLVDVHHDEGEPDGPDGCSPWSGSHSWHLVFENPRALDEPIPFKGGLGLRKVPQFDVVGDWLVERTNLCTCHGGAHGHRADCGWEPVAQLIPAVTA